MLSNVITSSLLSTGMLPIYSITRIIYIYLYFIYLSIQSSINVPYSYIQTFNYPIIYLSIYIFINPFIHHPSIHSYINPYIHSTNYLFIHQSIYHPYIQPSIHSTIHPSIHSFIHHTIHPLTLSLTYIRTIRKMIPLLLKQNNIL